MIQFKRKFYCFKIQETWFEFIYSIKNIFTLRSFSFIEQQINPYIYCIKEKTATLIIDLDENIDVIFDRFNKTVKQDIRKADSYQINCEFLYNKDLFEKFFNDFAIHKNIYQPKRKTIEAFADKYQTSFATSNGELLVAHSYIVDKDTSIVRLFQSASKRLDKNYDSKLISIANKKLTFYDMQYFKKDGFKHFDFGGFAENTSDKSLLGINQFKLSFGGKIKRYFVYYTPLLYLLIKLSRLIDRRY